MDHRVACYERSVTGRGVTAFEIRDAAPSLSDDQHPGRNVPRRQMQLPETVEPPGGEIDEIERCGTRSPDARGSLKHGGELPKVCREQCGHLEGEAGGRSPIGGEDIHLPFLAELDDPKLIRRYSERRLRSIKKRIRFEAAGIRPNAVNLSPPP